ncbi:MAG: hypothetical protein CMJ18_06745 [Phycisphaeraceae bacterium]|nr:hypothetical protein [Phycisphaeraceae bacterium]
MTRCRFTARSGRRAAAIVIAVLGWFGAGGCYERVIYDGWEQYRDLQGRGSSRERNAKARNDGSRSDGIVAPEDEWSILVLTFKGPGARSESAQWLGRLRAADGPYLTDLWVHEIDDEFHLMRGRYPGQTPSMERDLMQLHEADVDGHKALLDARPVRLRSLMSTSNRNLKAYVGYWPYSLQVAVYDSGTPATIRRNAQQYADALRKKGHLAFYYHGPQRSMVTVGLFTDDDRVPMSVTLQGNRQAHQYVYGPRIKALQKHFPHNLVNGHPFQDVMADGSMKPQPSALIVIK